GDLVEHMTVALELLDLLAEAARLLLGIPHAGDGDLLAGHVLGAQRLAQSTFVMGDKMGRYRQDVAGGAVVALEADDLRARGGRLEAQVVVGLGAAPAVDRLVVVADAADVGPGGATRRARVRMGGRSALVGKLGRLAPPLAEQAKPQILRHV